jgi:pimeloyl-ACP methyl ester carboxylesterase
MDSWDAQHQAPVRTWSAIEDLRIDGRQRHVIAPGQHETYSLDCLVIPRDSRTLVVALHGALNREVYTLPRFEWRTTLEPRNESLLFLADTALQASSDLKLAWYTGSASDDLTARYAALVRSVAVQCGADQIVLLGFSGGGFAALALAPLLAGSVALAFSPQVSIGNYYRVFADAYAEALFPQLGSFDEAEAAYGHRLNLLESYKDPDMNTNFVYVQNSGDAHHVSHHYRPFRELTEDRAGATFVLDHESDTHSVPSKERVGVMLDECLTMFCSAPHSSLCV